MSLRAAFARLAGAAALSQLIPMAAAPLLTRWYGAEALGHWALFAALAANLATVANARYEYAIVLPRRKGEAALLLQLSLWVALGVAGLSLVGMLLLQLLPQLPARLSPAVLALGPWWLALPMLVGLAGVQQALTLWNNRAGRYDAIASARVLQQGAAALAQLIAPLLLAASAGALVAGQLLGALLAPLWLLRRGTVMARRRPAPAAFLVRLARRYRQFPLVNSPHAFVNALQETLVIGLIATLAGAAEAGYYAVMVRLVKAPASLVGGALSELLLGRLARGWQAGEDLRPVLRRLLVRLALVALLPLALLLLAGPALFGWALGPEWARAGEYARWLAPYVAVHFVAAPLTVTPMVTGRQGGALVFSLVGNAIYVLAVAAVLGGGGGLGPALGLISLAMPLFFAVYLGWLLRGAAPGRRAAT